MGVLTKEVERRMLLWALSDPTDPNIPLTLPIMVRLMGTNGTVDTPGTEVVGDVYDPVEAVFGYSEGGSGATFVNFTVVEYNSVNSTTQVSVAGVELWDSSDTPVRVGLASLDAPILVAAGTTFSIAPGQLKVRLS